MRRVVVLFLITAFCFGLAHSEEKKDDKKSETKSDVKKEKPQGRSYLQNPEFAPYGIYSHLAYQNKVHGPGGYGPPQHGGYGQSFAHGGHAGHSSYSQHGASSHHASYASPQKGAYGQGQHGSYGSPQKGGHGQTHPGVYGSPQKGAYGQTHHGGHGQKHQGSPSYGGSHKDGKGHLAYTKKKIDSHLDKLHKLGNRRLQVQVDYGNTPLQYSYLQQYHNIPHPLTGTPFAKTYGIGTGGVYGAGYSMRSGHVSDYGQQGNYAQGNTYANYGPSHATQSSAYGTQNSYSTGGYKQQTSDAYAPSQGTTYGAQGSSYVQTEGQAQSAAYVQPQPTGYDQSQSASYGQTHSGVYSQSGGYGQTQTPSYGPAQGTDQTNSGTYGQSAGYGPTQSPDQTVPYPQNYPPQQPYSQPSCPLHCGPSRPVDPPQPPPYSPPIYQSNVLQPPNPYSFQPQQQLPNQMHNDQFQFSQPHGPTQPLYKSHQEQPQQYQTPNSNGQASYTQPISFTQENTYESGGSSNSGDDSTYLIGPQTQSFTAAKTGGYASENSNPTNPVTYVEEEKYQSSAPSNDYNGAGVSKRGPSLIDTFYTPL